MTWRRLRVLMSQLPRESRLVRRLDPRAEWSATDHLLASVIEALRAGNWQRGGGKGPRPRPLKRPGQEQGKRMGKARPLHETTDLFDRWRTGRLHAKERGGSHIHTRRGEVTRGRN